MANKGLLQPCVHIGEVSFRSIGLDRQNPVSLHKVHFIYLSLTARDCTH